MPDNVDTADNVIKEEEKIDDYDFEEEYVEEDKNRVGFFTKLKQALSPRRIIGYIVSNLWKPVLAFILIFTLFLGTVYAGSYFRLFNARAALDFEGTLTSLKVSDNFLVVNTMPVIEWTYATLAAAGDLMQSQIDIEAEAKKKQEEEAALALAKEEEEARKTQEAKEAKDTQARVEEQRPSGPSVQEQEKQRQKQEEELRRLAEAQQKELTKRANQLANYYAAMAPKDAVNILKNLDNDEIVLVLNRMENDAASQIMAAFEPDRASAISKEILRLHPTPTTIPSNIQGVL